MKKNYYKEKDLFRLARDFNYNHNKRVDYNVLLFKRPSPPSNSILNKSSSEYNNSFHQPPSAYIGESGIPQQQMSVGTRGPLTSTGSMSHGTTAHGLRSPGMLRDRAQESYQETISGIVRSINKLHDLKHRDWSPRDSNLDRTVSTISLGGNPNSLTGRGKTTSATPAPLPLETSYNIYTVPEGANSTTALKNRIYQTNLQQRKLVPMDGFRMGAPNKTVRTYSPLDKSYIESSAHIQNVSQKLTYLHLKSSGRGSSGNILVPETTGIEKAFENLMGSVNRKTYTVSKTSEGSSFIDGGGNHQMLANMESGKGHILSHAGVGVGVGGGEMRKQRLNNNGMYTRGKGMGQYSDLTRVTAPKFNMEYQQKLSNLPTLFRRQSGDCMKLSSMGKTYGPMFKFFKK